MCNVAIISAHTSPLALPGTRDSGGMNVYVRELSKELSDRANEMDIFTRRTDPGLPDVVQLDDHTRVIHIDAGPMDAEKSSLRHYLPAFLRGVLAFQERAGVTYDLLHSHYWLSGWIGQALKLHWQAPHIVMFHTLAEAKNRAYLNENEPDYRIEEERKIAVAADRIICASRDEAQLLVELCGAAPERISVVPCGVDLEHFRPLEKRAARARLGLSGGEPLMLFVGRIEPLKGIDVLLRAAAQIKAPYRLLVIGGDRRDDARRVYLRALVNELDIAGSVSFIDAVRHEDLPLYYNSADVCVVPSYYESFGLVALEAMACGVPVVASKVGGLPETVRDSQTGFLIPDINPTAFAGRLELLLGDPELRWELGAGARELAEQFHWANVAEQVEAVYHDLVMQYKGSVAHGMAGSH